MESTVQFTFPYSSWTWKKITQRYAIILIFLAASLIACVTEADASESSANGQNGFNIVMLLDESGSMLHSDKPKLTLDAACTFVDSLYAESLGQGSDFSGASVTVLGFQERIHEIAPWTRLSTRKQTDDVVSKIQNVTFKNMDPTDIGLAVKTAMDKLESAEGAGTRKNIVLLFTDGYIDRLAVDGWTQEQVDAWKDRSHRQLDEAVSRATENLDCEIYVIGFINFADYDDSGRIDDVIKGCATIRQIANKTQQGKGLVEPSPEDTTANLKVNYKITNDIKDVREFYFRLFASLMRSGEPISASAYTEDGMNYYDIDARKPGISQIKAYIQSDEAIGAITLQGPDRITSEDISNRTDIEMMGSPVQIIHRSHAGQDTPANASEYYILTISSPATGIWRVGAEGSILFDVRYVILGNFAVNLELHTNPGSPKCRAVITVSADSQGTEISQPETLYQSMKGTLYATSSDGNIKAYPLSYDKNALVCDFSVEHPGSYETYAELIYSASSSIEEKRISEIKTAVFTLPEVEKLPDTAVSQGQETILDVREVLLGEWVGMNLKIDGVSATPEGFADFTYGQRDGQMPGTLSIRGVNSTTGTFTVVATDNQGIRHTISGNLSVNRSIFDMLRTLAAVLITILIVIGIGYWIYRRLIITLPSGLIVQLELRDESSPPGSRKVQMRGDSFTLYKLVRRYLKSESRVRDVTALRNVVEQYKARLKSNDYRIHIITQNEGNRRTKTYVCGPNNMPFKPEMFVGDENEFSIKVDYAPEY